MISSDFLAVAVTSQPRNESELQLYRVLQRANLLSYYDTFIAQGGDDVHQVLFVIPWSLYRVIHMLGKNLLLTWFRHFWKLVCRYCSYLLPRQDGGTSQIQVNGRLLPWRRVTL